MAKSYLVRKVSFLRKAVIASSSVTKQKTAIHLFSDVDVSIPLALIEQLKQDIGEKISFTGYLAKSLSNVVEKHPQFNSFITGRKHVFLQQINISIMVDRKIGDESVPEPLVLRDCATRSLLDIHREIRQVQKFSQANPVFGNISGNEFVRYIPAFLLQPLMRLGDRSIKRVLKTGKLSISSVGMGCRNPFWAIPHGTDSVFLSVGSLNTKTMEDNGQKHARKFLCLTVSFDHSIVDGSAMARFMDDLMDEIKSGDSLQAISKAPPANP